MGTTCAKDKLCKVPPSHDSHLHRSCESRLWTRFVWGNTIHPALKTAESYMSQIPKPLIFVSWSLLFDNQTLTASKHKDKMSTASLNSPVTKMYKWVTSMYQWVYQMALCSCWIVEKKSNIAAPLTDEAKNGTFLSPSPHQIKSTTEKGGKPTQHSAIHPQSSELKQLLMVSKVTKRSCRAMMDAEPLSCPHQKLSRRATNTAYNSYPSLNSNWKWSR